MKTSLALLIALATSLAFAGPQCHKQGTPKDCPRMRTDTTAAAECPRKKDCPKPGMQCAKPCPKDSSVASDSGSAP